MTSCENIIESLPDYLEGTLDKEQFSEIENHLEQCEECRGERDFLVALFSLAPLAATPAPKDNCANVMKKIHALQNDTVSETVALPTTEPLEATVKSPASGEHKTFDFTKFFTNRKLMGGLVAACLVVIAIPLMSNMNKEKSIEPRSLSRIAGGEASDPAAQDVSENALTPQAPSASPNAVQFSIEDGAENDKSSNNDAGIESAGLGGNAAAEFTVREVISSFSETSVRYFNELTVTESFDLEAFKTSVGPECILETNLKYYFLLSDEIYSLLLNQVENKNQIAAYDTGTVKLDPMAKKGIVVVMK